MRIFARESGGGMGNGGFAWTVLLGALLACVSVGPEARQATAEPSESGLQARYYNASNLTQLKVVREDPRIDFSWGSGSPARSVKRDGFSARWTGKIEAPESGTYTFFTDTDDGARLWVDGRLIIDKWKSRGEKEWAGEIRLESGRLYDIRMEQSEIKGRATARLLWRGPGTAKQVVPSERLYLPGASLPPPDVPPIEPPPDGQLWSDPDTWGGDLPEAGDSVTVPAGKTVVLDVSPPELENLKVNGTLVFGDRDLELRSGWILVHGKLQIGTEQKPFTKDADITLTSSDKSEDVMGMGTKFLGVMGGTLELHGEPRRGWTKLARTADKGSDEITLADASGWRAGDRIVIASTDYDPNQAEEATITSVSGDTVTLDRALEYQHWGTVQTFGGNTIDERAEVGLLSRNIVVEGDQASENAGFGAQIMVMDGGEARVEGAELTRMGQKSVLRRYPLHFHMLGDAGANSYLKDSVIHRTYNRCVTIHGTNSLAISGNVCHDNIGHAFFMEDGAEHDNVFEGNLGLTTRVPGYGEEVAGHDRAIGGPATFWITNPDNVFRNNVAAGSDGHGFWYAIPEHPLGLSADDSVWPLRTPMGEFSGNVAHSNEVQGLRTHDSPNADGTLGYGFYGPRSNPSDPDSNPAVATYENFTAYKNRYHGVWLSGEHQVLSDAKLADNRVGATFASREVFLRDSFVAGETANKGSAPSSERSGLDGRSLPQPWAPGQPVIGYEFYDGHVGAERVAFANFASNPQRKAGALGYTHDTAYPIDPRNFAEGMSFSNANHVYLTDPSAGKDGDASKVFLDKDGSVTGKAGQYVVADNPFLLDSGCTARTEWNAYACPYDYVGLALGTLSSGPESIKPLRIEREDGAAQTLMGCCEDSTFAHTNLLSGRKYEVAFNGELPEKTQYIMRPSQKGWTQLEIRVPGDFEVKNYDQLMKPVDSLDALGSSAGTAYFYDSSNDTLHLKLVSNGYWEVASIERPG